MASMSWQTIGAMQIFPEPLEYWCGNSNDIGTKRIKNIEERKWKKEPMA